MTTVEEMRSSRGENDMSSWRFETIQNTTT